MQDRYRPWLVAETATILTQGGSPLAMLQDIRQTGEDSLVAKSKR
ncbi:hypothetical protein AKJ09_02291 [Labilithrix luteola]|uniref:Uncharacterized protein n=1 Tax=Labilithrix luteola TaxID=1391654 RepID=A0A0K1PQ25_9BACT|nr:hypothetical protein AKJ09_02291 [Labilithrix luteola]